MTVKREYFRQTPKREINLAVRKIIKKHLKAVRLEVLKRAAAISLLNFYERQYAEFRRLSPSIILTVLALMTLTGTNDVNEMSVSVAKSALKRQNITVTGNGSALTVFTADSPTFGVPLQEYQERYVKERVQPVIDRLIEQEAKDPDDISGRNSLRNRAEMEVRYNGHLQQIADLKARGVKLVIASTHSDCSKRCAPFQGRVFSLDGTRGTTDDGREYVPLEEATDVLYTTRAGITYKNGLLGFNCRHFLVEYKTGYQFPKPNAAEERKQYGITLRQRQLERVVRQWRTRAIEEASPEKRKIAKAKATAWNKEYIRYSRANNRAYYPSRTKII